MTLEVSYIRKENLMSTFLHNLPVDSINMSEIISASQKVETGDTVEKTQILISPDMLRALKLYSGLKIEEGFMVL